MKVSLIGMGKTKKRNVRESIISILSREFPLSIRKVYNHVKKEYSLDVTYQAVFKLIKEMVEDGVLEKVDKEYKLDMAWIKQLEDELKVIKSQYGHEVSNTEEVHAEINKFVAEIGPKLKEFTGKEKICILGIVGGGRFYAIAMWKYLTREGIDAKYVDYDHFKEAGKKGISINQKDVENRKIIVVNSSIYSGGTYRTIMEKLNKHKKHLKIKEIKWAVDKDMAGLADFSRLKG